MNCITKNSICQKNNIKKQAAFYYKTLNFNVMQINKDRISIV